MHSASTAVRLALGALLQGRADAEQALLPELLTLLNRDDNRPLASLLVDFASGDAVRREAATDLIGIAARAMCADDDAPISGDGAGVWRSLVAAADALHRSGVHAMGRLPFITDRLLTQLLDESRREGLAHSSDNRRTVGGAGDVLASLAVSRQLTNAVSDALGVPVVPTYDALYEFDPPGSRVSTHLDSKGYEIVFHLLVEQPSSRGDRGVSTLVVHLPNAPAGERIQLRVGECLALRGRGTIHSWDPLAPDERRTLIAIGFETARAASGDDAMSAQPR